MHSVAVSVAVEFARGPNMENNVAASVTVEFARGRTRHTTDKKKKRRKQRVNTCSQHKNQQKKNQQKKDRERGERKKMGIRGPTIFITQFDSLLIIITLLS